MQEISTTLSQKIAKVTMNIIILMIFSLIHSSLFGSSRELTRAAKSGNIDLVQRALRHGAIPEIPDKEGNTALFYACKYNHKDTLRTLLAAHRVIKTKEIKRALITGDADLAHRVIHAHQFLAGNRITKNFFLDNTDHTGNVKLLTIGVKTKILQPADITQALVSHYLRKPLARRSLLEIHRQKILRESGALKRKRPANQTEEEELQGPETEKETSGPQCGICLEPLSFRKKTRALLCYDSFHDTCITRWIKATPTCPTCRRKVNVPHNEIGFILPMGMQ